MFALLAAAHAEDLFVSSNERGASILLNGVDTGARTPATISGVKPGQTLVTVEGACSRGEAVVDVLPGLTTRASIVASEHLGSLTLVPVPADARLELDSAPFSGAPGVPMAVGCGSHTVRAALDGYVPAVITVDVGMGEEVTLPIRLAELGLGSLDLSVKPRNATIYLDGKPVGSDAVSLPSVYQGVHTISAELDGYQPAKARVVVEDGSAQAWHFELARGSGKQESKATQIGGDPRGASTAAAGAGAAVEHEDRPASSRSVASDDEEAEDEPAPSSRTEAATPSTEPKSRSKADDRAAQAEAEAAAAEERKRQAAAAREAARREVAEREAAEAAREAAEREASGSDREAEASEAEEREAEAREAEASEAEAREAEAREAEARESEARAAKEREAAEREADARREAEAREAEEREADERAAAKKREADERAAEKKRAAEEREAAKRQEDDDAVADDDLDDEPSRRSTGRDQQRQGEGAHVTRPGKPVGKTIAGVGLLAAGAGVGAYSALAYAHTADAYSKYNGRVDAAGGDVRQQRLADDFYDDQVVPTRNLFYGSAIGGGLFLASGVVVLVVDSHLPTLVPAPGGGMLLWSGRF